MPSSVLVHLTLWLCTLITTQDTARGAKEAVTFCYWQWISAHLSRMCTVTHDPHVHTQTLKTFKAGSLSSKSTLVPSLRCSLGISDWFDGCNCSFNSCLNTRNACLLKIRREREIWYRYKENGKGKEMMVVKRSVLCFFWWAQLSQTASTDCQPLKIAGYFSLFALWAYSQKVIKITSSLLSNSWKLQESEILFKLKQWRKQTPMFSIEN